MSFETGDRLPTALEHDFPYQNFYVAESDARSVPRKMHDPAPPHIHNFYNSWDDRGSSIRAPRKTPRPCIPSLIR